MFIYDHGKKFIKIKKKKISKINFFCLNIVLKPIITKYSTYNTAIIKKNKAVNVSQDSPFTSKSYSPKVGPLRGM